MNSIKMLQKPSAVLFDLDGTLVDTAPDFACVLEKMTSTEGIVPLAYQAVHETVSNGAKALVELAFGIDQQNERFKELHATLLFLYGEQLLETRSSLYPAMNELLELLEQNEIKWGVVTNKPEQFSTSLLRCLGLLERCQTLICPEQVTFTKPHPEPLLLACNQMGCNPNLGIYVGDHPRDITAGSNAGMFTIAAAYGYIPPSPPVSEWGADLVVDHPRKIIEYLTGKAWLSDYQSMILNTQASGT